jgi:phosphoribosylaminoimidazolecarboxamide formyltransferase/IMP cyclohydrolase
VSDKTGLVEFARALQRAQVEILSTGGTAHLLGANGIAVTDVAQYTGFPEIMGGRVKTLHPRIHGALLGRSGTDDAVMAEHGIVPIDLAVVNLYPFSTVSAHPATTYEEAVENIDIGGPAMVRAAAKNHERVAVVVDPLDYPLIIAELTREAGATTLATRTRLAAKAFMHITQYDAQIARFLLARHPQEFPTLLTPVFERIQTLRYGENPHQRAAFYRDVESRGACVANARLLQGKELSFNNIADTDAAVQCVRQFERARLRHRQARQSLRCGERRQHSAAAYERAYRTDPTSAFGGIIAFNRELDADAARAILERQFVEVILAPGVSKEAQALLLAKNNIRVLQTGDLGKPFEQLLEYKSVAGGLLVQTRDEGAVSAQDLRVVTKRQPTPLELEDLLFAWRVGKYVKSNAIVCAKDKATVGIGAGQMSRVVSSRIAALKAQDEGLSLQAASVASDAYFPFRDGLDVIAEFGVKSVIQPGGSKRDAEVIGAADEHGIAMVFTGTRHFRH